MTPLRKRQAAAERTLRNENRLLRLRTMKLERACYLAMEACLDNLSRYAYKNEPLLLAAFKSCEAALKRSSGGARC